MALYYLVEGKFQKQYVEYVLVLYFKTEQIRTLPINAGCTAIIDVHTIPTGT
jgi:hypothetical protein